jgi:hypothetical protein
MTVLLGRALCNGHGDFNQVFTVPAGLPTGLYELQVIDPSVAGVEVVMAVAPVRVSTTAEPVNAVQTFPGNETAAVNKRLALVLAGLLLTMGLVLYLVPFIIQRRRDDDSAASS